MCVYIYIDFLHTFVLLPYIGIHIIYIYIYVQQSEMQMKVPFQTVTKTYTV